MISELVIINTKRSADIAVPKYPLGLQWATCLRQINIFSGSEFSLIRAGLRPGQEVYRGVEAYRFLLEVVCGLHSPIIGETEVMGQFREFCASTDFPSTPWGYSLKQLMNELLTDAKRIRHQYLHNQGSQSYGSLAARYLKGIPAVVFLGAGKLVKEMLPWLMAQAKVTVVNRSLRSAERLREDQAGLRIADLADESLAGWLTESTGAGQSSGAALVVAAPLTAAEIADWAARQVVTFARTLDLRGESAHDPLVLNSEVLDLNSFFTLLEEERRRASDISARAGEEIRLCAEQHLKQMQCRPFGWEDLCA
jgi:glutamyl-tRNA reductase